MKKILLIDDSKTQLLNSKFTLQKGGFLVETLTDPLKALEVAVVMQPDLIITDINMPGKDGITLMRDFRMVPELKATPILVMSTDSQQHLFEQARSAGASGWLMKPVNQQDLLAATRKLLPQE